MSGGEWAEDLTDFLQAGDLNPNGVVIGLGADLPPPLNTYLISGIAYYSAGTTWGYTGIRFNGTSYIVEDGLVLSDNTIVPISYRVAAGLPGRPAIRYSSDVLYVGGQYVTTTDVPLEQSLIDADFSQIPAIVDNVNVIFNYRNGAVLQKQTTDLTSGLTIVGGGTFAKGNATLVGQAYQLGRINIVRIYLNWGTTSNQGTGTFTFGGLPQMATDPDGLSAIPGHWWYVKPASTQRATGPILMAPGATTIQCEVGGGTPTLAPVTAIGSGIPEAWASGAQLKIHLVYEGATAA